MRNACFSSPTLHTAVLPQEEQGGVAPSKNAPFTSFHVAVRMTSADNILPYNLIILFSKEHNTQPKANCKNTIKTDVAPH